MDIYIILMTAIKVVRRKDTIAKNGNFEVPFDEFMRR
jgi:hypothetical protein